MPHYFFHVKDGVRLVTDKVGKDLPDLSAARAEAETLAGYVRSELGGVPQLVNELRVEIVDHNGKLLSVVGLDGRPRFA